MTESKETPKIPTSTSLANDFKAKREEREKGEILELTEGKKIKVKKPSIRALVKSGKLPANLVNEALAGVQAEGDGFDLTKYLELMESMVLLSVLEPKLVEGEANYEEGEISLDDLTDEDKAIIFNWVNGGVAELTSFRQ